jgi:hypothetical protein
VSGEQQQESLSGRFGRLTAAASKLAKEVGQNTDAIDSLMRRAKLAERFITIISISLIMDFALTIAVGILAYQSYSTNERIATVCPLYAFIVGSYAPQTRAAGPDRDQYVASFEKMQIKFSELGCGPDYPIVPGAAHPPAAAPSGN